MPLVAIKLDQALYARALQLVEGGDYRDVHQLIEVALRNQVQLEERCNTSSGFVTETSKDDSSALQRKARTPIFAAPKTPHLGSALKDNWVSALTPFRFDTQQSRRLEPCTADVRPADELMYSLVNRLFPLKLIARWLDVSASRADHWPAVQDAVSQIGSAIEAVGSALAHEDVNAGRRRDDQLATSLPRRENLKSKDRFLTQFVVRTTDGGDTYPAAIIQFALAAIKNGQFVLSREGQELSRLPNPLLDGTNPNVSETLTDDERTLLIQQVRAYMPAEARYQRALLNAISKGCVSPNQVIEALQGQFPNGITEAAFRSHLSGVIARSIDLGLVRRRWEGRHVFYTLTDAAAALSDAKEASNLKTN